MSKAELVTQSRITQRGWSKTMVANLLGEPDKLAPNPMYKSAAPMRLYDLARVKKIELSSSFKKAKARADKRRAAIEPSIDKRRKELLEKVRAEKVVLQPMSKPKLRRLAINSYNEHNESGWSVASVGDDPTFLNRIMVNYLRHECTNYDHDLWTASGEIGVREAQTLVRAKTYKAIAHAYPYLADECEQQAERRQCDLSIAEG